MSRKLKSLLVFSALLLTMCRFYDGGERVAPVNGLSCQGYTDYFKQGLGSSKGLECYYTCSDKVIVGPFDLALDPSSSKEELDRQFCSITPQVTSLSTPTELAATTTPPPAVSPTAQASATAAIPPTSEVPLLTGEVTMCDQTTDLISFRIAESAPDVTGKNLAVKISELEMSCTVNPVNTSLLTCTLPATVTFPTRVVVSLEGAVVNDFTYDGVGCILVDTPIPT